MSKIISELTLEQQDKIPIYREKFRKIGLSTTPTNKKKAEEALSRLYEYLNKKDPVTWKKDPEFVWAKSPYEGAVLTAQFAKGDENVTEDEIRAQADNASFGSLDAYWVSTYSFIANELPVEVDELHKIVTEIIEECGIYWTFSDLVVVTTKPTKICIENDQLHSIDGMALQYENGDGVYVYRGEKKGSLMEVVMANRNEKT